MMLVDIYTGENQISQDTHIVLQKNGLNNKEEAGNNIFSYCHGALCASSFVTSSDFYIFNQVNIIVQAAHLLVYVKFHKKFEIYLHYSKQVNLHQDKESMISNTNL